MSLYLIKSYKDYYKIGITNSLKRRLKYLDTASPFKLKLIHNTRGSCKNIERFMHNLFIKNHIRLEWFKLSPYEVNKFKKICTIYDTFRKKNKIYYGIGINQTLWSKFLKKIDK